MVRYRLFPEVHDPKDPGPAPGGPPRLALQPDHGRASPRGPEARGRQRMPGRGRPAAYSESSQGTHRPPWLTYTEARGTSFWPCSSKLTGPMMVSTLRMLVLR